MAEELHHDDGRVEHPTVRHEHSDASFRSILFILIGAVVCGVAIFCGALWFLYGYGREQAAMKTSAFPLAGRPSNALPRGPRLEQVDRLAGDESPNVYDREAANLAILNSYGLSNEQEFIHIPIDRAMQQLLRDRTLKVRPAPSAEDGAGPADFWTMEAQTLDGYFSEDQVMRSVKMAWIALVMAPLNSAWGEDTALPPSLRQVAFDQHLNGQVPLELEFKDEAGRPVHLAEYFGHGKPVILVLAYFRCPMLCTEVLNGLVRSMLDVQLELGRDFDVVTVSFDPRETPAMATAKKKTYLDRYGHPGAETGWHFLTGTQDSITRLADAVGFRYYFDARKDQFAHASGIMILTPLGKIARYFFDIQFASRDLRLALVEASENRIGSAVDQILLFCFHYDPAEGKYGPAIMNILRVAGVLTVLGIGLLILILRRQERRRVHQGATVVGVG